MTAFILAKKVKQTQGYDDSKHRVSITELDIPECYITQVKTMSSDGYWAFQIGIQTRSLKNVKKPDLGKTKQAGIKTPLSFFKEVRLKKTKDIKETKHDQARAIQIGEKIYYEGMPLLVKDLFTENLTIQVTGTSKGKGFQGVMKRHRFAGGPKTHGQSDRARAPGSIGVGTTPGRVWKGKKMAGRMGGEQITVKGLKVLKIEENKLFLKGLVPGARNSILLVRSLN